MNNANGNIVKQYFVDTYPMGNGLVLHNIIVNLARNELGENISYISDGCDVYGKRLAIVVDGFYPTGNIICQLDEDKNNYWWRRYNWDYHWIRDEG